MTIERAFHQPEASKKFSRNFFLSKYMYMYMSCRISRFLNLMAALYNYILQSILQKNCLITSYIHILNFYNDPR